MEVCEENCKLHQQVREAQLCDIVDKILLESIPASSNEGLIRLINTQFSFNCSDPNSYLFENVQEDLTDLDTCTHIFSPELEGRDLKSSIASRGFNALVSSANKNGNVYNQLVCVPVLDLARNCQLVGGNHILENVSMNCCTCHMYIFSLINIACCL